MTAPVCVCFLCGQTFEATSRTLDTPLGELCASCESKIAQAGYVPVGVTAREGMLGGIPADEHYRDGSRPTVCASCSYYGAGTFGRCGMFDVLVEPEMVCDAWEPGPIADALPETSDWTPNALTAGLPKRRARNLHSVEVHNGILERAYARVDEMEPLLADVLAPILHKAGGEAASAFLQHVTDHLTASALVSAALDLSAASTMVCVKPRAEEAAALATGNERAEDLHVTLAYLGEYDGDLSKLAAALATVAAGHAPLAGTVAGYGVFAAPGPWPAILLPDVPGLVELRVAVTEALVAHEVEYARNHGFEAHITIEYVDAGPDDGPFTLEQAGQPIHFDELLIVRGNTETVPVPLTGIVPLTAAGKPRGKRPSWTAPAADELINAHRLVKQIAAKTAPVREKFVKAVMTPALKAAGISFDVTNPLTAKALASTAKHITSIAQTTQLNVMRIIHESYDQGLSIPQTAEAIRTGMKDASFTRATMIARTELAGAVNSGSLASTTIISQETGDTYFKRWMTAPGAHFPRHETYEDLDGQTVALDEYFEVGDSQLSYPADPDGDPGEVINCRCALSYTDERPDDFG